MRDEVRWYDMIWAHLSFRIKQHMSNLTPLSYCHQGLHRQPDAARSREMAKAPRSAPQSYSNDKSRCRVLYTTICHVSCKYIRRWCLLSHSLCRAASTSCTTAVERNLTQTSLEAAAPCTFRLTTMPSTNSGVPGSNRECNSRAYFWLTAERDATCGNERCFKNRAGRELSKPFRIETWPHTRRVSSPQP